jgi:hypothetical protein
MQVISFNPSNGKNMSKAIFRQAMLMSAMPIVEVMYSTRSILTDCNGMWTQKCTLAYYVVLPSGYFDRSTLLEVHGYK